MNEICRSGKQLERATFRTSRLLDFCSEKELIAQTGHRPEAWPLVVLKELVDNALDACEEARTAPEITVKVDDTGITVSDNGPGIPAETVADVLDFSLRVSSREAYVAPDRGAQGNALKTIVAMPFVLDGESGRVEVATATGRHRITFGVNAIRQEPVISHDHAPEEHLEIGTEITVVWPVSACSIITDAKDRFLQFASDYTWVNPHLTLHTDWFGEAISTDATDAAWAKWKPSDPTCPHWYSYQHLERLIAGYVGHDQDNGHDRTVREFVSEFRGLSSTRKQKAVIEATGLARATLSSLYAGGGVDEELVRRLLQAMKEHSRPVKPPALGIIGQEHFRRRFKEAGCELDSFQYKKVPGTTDGVPWVVETAFGWCPQAQSRRLVTGVNWSPGIINPFRELGQFGASLDTILSQQRADRDEPVVLVLHMACPRVEYTDRGKSAVVVEG